MPVLPNLLSISFSYFPGPGKFTSPFYLISSINIFFIFSLPTPTEYYWFGYMLFVPKVSPKLYCEGEGSFPLFSGDA
jgi:hypothetical protein